MQKDCMWFICWIYLIPLYQVTIILYCGTKKVMHLQNYIHFGGHLSSFWNRFQLAFTLLFPYLNRLVNYILDIFFTIRRSSFLIAKMFTSTLALVSRPYLLNLSHCLCFLINTNLIFSATILIFQSFKVLAMFF